MRKRPRVAVLFASFALAFSAAAGALRATVATAADPSPLGLVPSGQSMFTYVGKIDQNGPLADDVGFLTTVAGLDESQLFAGGDPLGRTEQTARIVYFASARLLTRSVNGNLFVTTGTAQTTLYFSDGGGASFDDPASFKRGTPIATFDSTWQDIVNVQAPNMGVASAVSDETERSATPFTVGGTQYVFGRVGLRFRLTFTGEGTRTDPTTPRSSILYGGSAVPIPQASLAGVQAVGAGGTSGWAVAAFVVGLVALVAAMAAVMISRRNRAGPS